MRFQATGLIFPTEGCWEVTAKAADSVLSFVVRVEPWLIYDGLPMEESGRHHFVVEIQMNGDWHQVASVPLAVKFSQTDTDEEGILPSLEEA